MRSIAYSEIVAILSDILRDSPEFVFVHSGVASFGRIASPVESCLAAWNEARPLSSTLIMPTFTFSFCRMGIFDSEQTPSETGILSEYFRCQKGVVRSKHPIYSVAACGPRAEEVANLGGDSCWGQGTVFELLERENALIVGFGVLLSKSATIMHRAEEISQVPYRYCKTFEGKRVTRDGSEICQTHFWVRRLDIDIDNDFSPVIAELSQKGLHRRVHLGSSAIEYAYSRDICRVAMELIQNDPLAVVADRDRIRAEIYRPLISFLGSSNLDLLAQATQEEYQKWDNTGIGIVSVPFGQYKPHILKEDSELRVADPQVIVFLERMEDLCGGMVIDPYGEGFKVFRRNLEEYLITIQHTRRVMKGFIIVFGFFPTLRSTLGNIDHQFPEGLLSMAKYGNARIEEALKGIGDLCILDFASMLIETGIERRSRKYWYLGRLPFAGNGLKALARGLTGAILARCGKSARMLVLDLDNTLWGGSVGEDGFEGLQLGGDYPGNAYLDFQRALRLLKERGIALAIASKNTESVALEAIDQHPEMILKRDDFATWRINWQEKASNIQSICEEIGLGLGSICFLDDNPNEREWVKSQLPEVFVPELPDDPAERPHFLLDLPCLDLVDFTEEDRHRAEQYRKQHEIRTQQQAYENIEDFYRSLNMVVTICGYRRDNKARVLQLIAKTNQFNTTTRRYSEADLEELIAQGFQVYAVKLRDRFRKEEIIGVLIVDWKRSIAEIDSFMLSCRVLGYGIETAILGWLRKEGLSRNSDGLIGEIVETARNQIVRVLYRDNGFEKVENEKFLLRPLMTGVEVPDWICLETDLPEGAEV